MGEDEKDFDSVSFSDSGDCHFLFRHGKVRLQSLTKKLCDPKFTIRLNLFQIAASVAGHH